jgi:S-adenosylmethionine/arginine decarboxylase-like enzyme
MEKFNPYHQHLLVKCWATNPPKQEEELNKWFINLVETVGMKVVAGPTSVYVSDPGNEGLTGTVTLATSHASIHIWDNLELPMIQFDIYSCKCFTLEQVMDCFEPFGLVKSEWIMIDRNDKPTIISEGSWWKK